jgi:hypothetical protein
MRDLESEPITSEERWGVIERICASNELKRAARLRDLLRYVGQRSLQADAVQISEYEIGMNVFNRHENYDTSSDNIVRVNFSELRKRIAAYYATEGINEKILVNIPRGSYTPQFSLRSAIPATSDEERNSAALPEPKQAALASPSSRTTSWWLIARHHAAITVASIMTIACLYLAFQNRALQNSYYSWKSQSTLGPFWSGILESPRDTDIVLADTSVATVEYILRQHITLEDYLNHSYYDQIQASELSPQLKSDLENLAGRNNGSVSDFRVALKILALDPKITRIHLQYARDFRPRNATGHNIILIGSSVSNPWTSMLQDQLNFVIGYDADTRQMIVRNRRPQAGESAVYTSSTDSASYIDYSTVDYVPNRNQSGDALIIAGTNSVATEAAGIFLTQEDSLSRFADLLHTRSLPYFELLLKTTRLQGAPITAEILAYRTLPGHPLGSR